MNDLQIERLARSLADQLAAGRRATFTTNDGDLRQRILSRVRNILAGQPTIEETPD